MGARRAVSASGPDAAASPAIATHRAPATHRARATQGAPATPTCFCRDCLVDLDAKAGRCGACGSPRLVRHRSLPNLTLAHIDCDAFYATVEKRDNPEI